MNKKLLLVSALSLLCSVVLPGAEKKPTPPIDDVYNFFAPSEQLKSLPISISGDELEGGRVSLFPGEITDLPETDAKTGCKVQFVKMKNWGGEDSRAFRLWGDAKISPDEWTKIVVSFKPRVAGTVRFAICIDYGGIRKECDYRDLKFASVAKLECKGAIVKDTLFDKLPGLYKNWNQKKNNLKDWEAKTKPTVVKDPKCPSGKFYVKTCQSLSQAIKVKKDTEVTISFYIKGNDIFYAKQ